MTIALCYLSPEGIVLGADSTTSTNLQAGFHYYNHAQKLFQLGEDSTLGILIWGLGGLGTESHRTHIAYLADDLRANPPADVLGVANRWIDRFWAAYTSSPEIAPLLVQCQSLANKQPHDPNAAPDPDMRTKDEENTFELLRRALVAGFCVAGYVPPDRTPHAYEIVFDPLLQRPAPVSLVGQLYRGWGAPNMIDRLITGADAAVKNEILTSGMWNGTAADLEVIVAKHALRHPILPIRDAIDFVYSCIHSTIKGLKFSQLSQICGGPVEIAVITTDRKFRWVRHKSWDAAVAEGAL